MSNPNFKKRSSWFTRSKSIELIPLGLVLTLLSTALLSQVRPSPLHDQVIQQIKTRADGDVKGGAPLNDVSTIEIFQDEGKVVGISAQEISEIYRREYFDARDKKKPIWERIPTGFYPILLVLTFFWKPLKIFIEEKLKAVYEALYARYAGAKLFRGRALARYCIAIRRLHSTFKMPFRDSPLQMSNVYVPLRVLDENGTIPIDAVTAISEYPRLVVKGVPGAGKSMLLRSLLLSYANGTTPEAKKQFIPVLVELSRLNDPLASLEAEIVQAFDRYGFPKSDSFVSWALAHDALLLLLDGLDEVNALERTRVAATVIDLTNKTGCRFIVTCRTQVYKDEFASVSSRTLEVSDFADSDLLRFLDSWKPSMKKDQSVEHLMQTLQARPRILALARNPLLLTMIAYLYTDQNMVLPHSRGEFYRQSTALLLEKWQGGYNRFGVPAKLAVLTRLALEFQAKPSEDRDRRTLSFEEVLRLVRDVLPGTNVKVEGASDLLDEIVERTGLLLRIDGGTRFQFAHLTMQESLAATALIERSEFLFESFHTDPDTWREVIKLWCGLTNDATEMIVAINDIETITAMECLADARYLSPEVAERIIAQAQESLRSYRLLELTANRAPQVEGSTDRAYVEPLSQQMTRAIDSTGISRAFGLLASMPGPRGKAMLNWLMDLLQDPDMPEQVEVANALAYSNLEEAARLLLRRSTPITLSALKQMGDVAVRPLLQDKQVDLLVDIATPRSLTAVASLLWHDELVVRTTAARAVSQKLKELKIETSLKAANLGGYESDHRFDWFWEPFQEPADSMLPKIVSKCASALADPSCELNDYENIDRRLLIPLYILTRRDALLKTITKLSNDSTVDELDGEIVADWVRRVRFKRPLTKEDWLHIFRPSRYKFSKSWHFWVCNVILGAAAAIGLILALRFVHLTWPWKIAQLAASLCTFFWIVFETYVAVEADRSSDVGMQDVYVRLVGGGAFPWLMIPIIFRRSVWTEDLKSAALGIVLATSTISLPISLYMCYTWLSSLLNWHYVMLFLPMVYATLGSIIWRAFVDTRKAENPLTGLVAMPARLRVAPKKRGLSIANFHRTKDAASLNETK